MPTAAEYRNLATLLRNSATEVEQCWNEHGSNMDSVEFEAPCRLPIDQLRSQGVSALEDLLIEIDEQIRVAEYRAAVCEQYTRDLRAHQLNPDPYTMPPPPPASWVKAG